MIDNDQPFFDVQNARVFRGMRCVFDELSISFKEGEHVAILGPNGAGKTTLLKLITREISPVARDGSYIKLFGESRVNIWQLREKIGVVSQDFQTKYEALATGLDVVLSAFFGSVGIHGHHDVNAQQIEQAEAELARFGISELRDRQFLQLSSGQQRRLLLARACIHKPKVLVFDEPTNSLDVRAAFQILEDMRKLTHEGCTIVLVTHHLQEVIPEISRVALLEDGKVIFDGEKDNAFTKEKLSSLFQTPLDIHSSNGFYNWIPTN